MELDSMTNLKQKLTAIANEIRKYDINATNPMTLSDMVYSIYQCIYYEAIEPHAFHDINNSCECFTRGYESGLHNNNSDECVFTHTYVKDGEYSHSHTGDCSCYNKGFDDGYYLGYNDGYMYCDSVWSSYQPSMCCFEAGTQVLISIDGETKNIEDISKGDTVISYNIDSNTLYKAECAELIIHENTTDLAEVILENGSKLIMNAYHPILTTNGFKSLTMHNDYPILKLNDIAITTNGESKITSIRRYIAQNPITTYTLNVVNKGEDPDNDVNDTFIANGIVVHNSVCAT